MVRVVAKKWFRNVTSNIAKFSLFRSEEGGDFRISLYASVASGQTGQVNLYWDDNTLGNTQAADVLEPAFAFSNPQVGWNTIVINLAPGGSISLETVTIPPSGSWDFYVTVEGINNTAL